MTISFRGLGLYVVGVRDNEMVLIKTLGEWGYILPKEFRHIDRYGFEEGSIIDTFGLQKLLPKG
jgi:hypothetical protein